MFTSAAIAQCSEMNVCDTCFRMREATPREETPQGEESSTLRRQREDYTDTGNNLVKSVITATVQPRPEGEGQTKGGSPRQSLFLATKQRARESTHSGQLRGKKSAQDAQGSILLHEFFGLDQVRSESEHSFSGHS